MTRSPTLATLLIGLLVFAAVSGLRANGWLEGLELALYDRHARAVAVESQADPGIVLVGITEEDISELGHPINDRSLADLLSALVDADALVVGVDLYRNLPVPPGERLLDSILRREQRIIAVRKFGDAVGEDIHGPPSLEGTDRVGFNDLKLDRDTSVRRGILFLDDGERDVQYAFALRVALLALADRGVVEAGDPQRPEWLRLGPTTIPPFGAHDGGYRAADDRGYQFLVDCAAGAGGFESHRLGAVLRGDVDPARLRHKIVLVGVNAESLPDVFHVPTCRRDDGEGVRITGVELHGHMIDQLMRFAAGRSRPLRVLSELEEALLILALAGLGSVLGLATRGRGAAALTLTALVGAAALWFLGAALHRAGWWIPLVGPGVAWLSALGAVVAWSSRQERSERALVMRLFSSSVSSRVADEILKRRDEFLREGRVRARRMVATVLFLDMKGYSAHAEKMDPELLMSWANEFMGTMAARIDEFGGIVDDYFGDGLKASFGVPFSREREEEIAADARRAVNCALDMAGAVTELNASYRERGLPTVAMRIGIDTGPVVAGQVGGAEHLKYTVVGDVVVTAQRLESLDATEHDFEHTPCRVFASGAARRHLDATYLVEALGPMALKGRGAEVEVFRIRGRTTQS
jgi:adenylate cyclase